MHLLMTAALVLSTAACTAKFTVQEITADSTTLKTLNAGHTVRVIDTGSDCAGGERLIIAQTLDRDGNIVDRGEGRGLGTCQTVASMGIPATVLAGGNVLAARQTAKGVAAAAKSVGDARVAAAASGAAARVESARMLNDAERVKAKAYVDGQAARRPDVTNIVGVSGASNTNNNSANAAASGVTQAPATTPSYNLWGETPTWLQNNYPPQGQGGANPVAVVQSSTGGTAEFQSGNSNSFNRATQQSSSSNDDFFGGIIGGVLGLFF